jgi:polyisoprenoid-binding protein YceI
MMFRKDIKFLAAGALASVLAMCFYVKGSASPVTAPEPAAKAAQEPLPEPGAYNVDVVHTFVNFSAQHKVVGRVDGRFEKFTGAVNIARSTADVTVDVTIDAASINTKIAMRDDDLRGPDFFDVAHFPAAEYHGRGVHKTGAGWVVDGALTIRGITKPAPLFLTFRGVAPGKPGEPQRLAFNATTMAKRADFGMVRDLLEELGPASDSPDVWINIDAELVGAAANK